MSETASISANIAGRYAQAVFDLARDDAAIGSLETDVDALDAALGESPELRDLIASPLYGREEQGAAIGAIAAKMGLSALTANTLALLASKRRLFVLPQFVAVLRRLVAEEKGEITAEVTAAAPLSDAQQQRLAASLSASSGKTVKLKLAVDESLIGGLVVRLGSKMIDTSVASKLASLQNAMKEVG